MNKSYFNCRNIKLIIEVKNFASLLERFMEELYTKSEFKS